ncbi:MAG: hypothetical protein GY701_33000, partial [Sulfitobacter sp.]|nr:hypothetical protein [Sulfitobacter sp.]
MGKPLVFIGSVALVASSVAGITSQPAEGMSGVEPPLELPFACGEKVKVSTYSGHGQALDMYDDDWTVSSQGMAVVNPSKSTATVKTTTPDNVPEGSSVGVSVTLDLGGGWTAYFTHLQPGSLTEFGTNESGAVSLAPGQPFARVGWTGYIKPKNAKNAHLHVELFYNGVAKPYKINGTAVSADPNGRVFDSGNVHPSGNCGGEGVGFAFGNIDGVGGDDLI